MLDVSLTQRLLENMPEYSGQAPQDTPVVSVRQPLLSGLGALDDECNHTPKTSRQYPQSRIRLAFIISDWLVMLDSGAAIVAVIGSTGRA